MLFVLKMTDFFIFVRVAHKKNFWDDFLPHPPEAHFFQGGHSGSFIKWRGTFSIS